MRNCISIGKLEDFESSSFKLKLEGDMLQRFNGYLAAYEESYQTKPDPEKLLCHLVDFALKKDSKFKAWYNKWQKQAELID